MTLQPAVDREDPEKLSWPGSSVPRRLRLREPGGERLAQTQQCVKAPDSGLPGPGCPRL